MSNPEVINQRRTTAAQTGVTKPAGAMNSAFDVLGVKTARSPHMPIDPAAVAIKKNVPLPPAIGRRAAGSLALLGRMGGG